LIKLLIVKHKYSWHDDCFYTYQTPVAGLANKLNFRSKT